MWLQVKPTNRGPTLHALPVVEKTLPSPGEMCVSGVCTGCLGWGKMRRAGICGFADFCGGREQGLELDWMQGGLAAKASSQCHQHPPPAPPSTPSTFQARQTDLSLSPGLSGHGLWLVGSVVLPAPPPPLAVCPVHNKYSFEDVN